MRGARRRPAEVTETAVHDGGQAVPAPHESAPISLRGDRADLTPRRPQTAVIDVLRRRHPRRIGVDLRRVTFRGTEGPNGAEGERRAVPRPA